MRWLSMMLVLLPGLAFGAASQTFVSPRDQVRLVSAANTAPGGKIELGLAFRLAPGWHIYWSNPGDAGVAPVVSPQGAGSFGPLAFPPPELLVQGPVTDYVLSGDVLLPFMATGIGDMVTAQVRWLVCADICVPEHAMFTLALNGGVAAQAGLFAPSEIVPSPFRASITSDGVLHVAGPSARTVAAARFFPDAPGMIVNGAPQRLAFTADGLDLQLSLAAGGPPPAGLLELTDPAGGMQALSVTPAPARPAAAPPYLWLAFLGGLILNLMPCVFPILALKTLAIARLGGGAGARGEALGYTAGVLIAMLAVGVLLLALRGLGMAAGWGFQFQSPVFVALMAWLFLAIALNLAGVFEVPMPGMFRRVSGGNSVLTGMLAVVVATPCTAPFMGAAVAASLTAPVPLALGIFLSLGLGLALPFLLLACLPRLARLLPRPGAWMLWLQRALSVPMFLAVLWLAWVLFRQAGAGGLALLGLGAACLLAALSVRQLRPLGLAALLVLPFMRLAPAAALSLPGSEPYTAARLAALRAAGRPVFIDLTAAWCVTCLVNEATTLKNPGVQTAMAAKRVALLVGDWTNKAPEISALLSENHRAGVPLYLYYAPGVEAPAVLPQVLSPQSVEKALLVVNKK
jgi:thiol:disulfide interchange protein DsbD